MELKLTVDSIAGIPAQAFSGRMVRNTVFTISGWAFDAASRSVPPVVLRIDGVTALTTSPLLSRPDVALYFGDESLGRCGFILSVPANVAIGRHQIEIGAEEEDGAFVSGIQFVVECVAQVENTQPSPRLLIAAAPKSGSTYTLSVLRTYFAVAHPPLEHMYWNWEQNLDGWVLDRVRNRPFVLQMHLKAYDHQLEVMQAEEILPVVTWRNLADTIVSYDDHIRKENLRGTDFMFYMNAPEYLSMPDQDRYRFLIAYIVPWYVSFYLGWRTDRAHLFMRYELLAADSREFFRRIITYASGSVDDSKLEAILGQRMAYSQNRLNAGINGRANEKMSDETKGLLESSLRNHFTDLTGLIRELPWNDGAHSVLAQTAAI